MIETEIVLVLLLAMLSVSAAQHYVHARLIRQLRTVHPKTWELLECPDPTWNNTIRNGWLTLRFVMSGSYRELEDPVVNRLGTWDRALTFLGLLVVAASVVLVVPHLRVTGS